MLKLQAVDVSKSYRGRKVVDDIDLEIRPLPPPRSDDLVDLVASLGCLTHGRHIATPRRRGYTEPTADGCEHTEMGSPISWH